MNHSSSFILFECYHLQTSQVQFVHIALGCCIEVCPSGGYQCKVVCFLDRLDGAEFLHSTRLPRLRRVGVWRIVFVYRVEGTQECFTLDGNGYMGRVSEVHGNFQVLHGIVLNSVPTHSKM